MFRLIRKILNIAMLLMLIPLTVFATLYFVDDKEETHIPVKNSVFWVDEGTNVSVEIAPAYTEDDSIFLKLYVEGGAVLFNIYDDTNKEGTTYNEYLVEGKNTIEIEQGSLMHNGVLDYQINVNGTNITTLNIQDEFYMFFNDDKGNFYTVEIDDYFGEVTDD